MFIYFVKTRKPDLRRKVVEKQSHMHAFCHMLEFADLKEKKIFFFSSVDFKLRKATLCGPALQVVPIRHNADTTQGAAHPAGGGHGQANRDLTRKQTCCLNVPCVK